MPTMCIAFVLICFVGMRMTDPKPQFSHIVETIAKSHPDLAYIHIIGAGADYNKGPDDPSVC